MKRSRVLAMGEGSLTGGTGDVSPQWMSFSATQSAADTTTTTTQAIPVQRLPQGGRAQVLELLKVVFEYPSWAASASATEANDQMACYLSTSSFGTTAVNFSEPRVFAGTFMQNRNAFTAAGTYFAVWSNQDRQDTTDGAGHGVLIATDNIYAQVQTVGSGNSNTFRIKLLYRWKNVSLQEYVGIVQSQQ